MAYFYDKEAKMLLFLEESSGRITVMQDCSINKDSIVAEPVINTVAPEKKKYNKAPKVAGGGSVSKEPGTKKRLTPEQTLEIENMLIGKHPVTEICEATGVSNPTVYVIKTRLKNEGKLS